MSRIGRAGAPLFGAAVLAAAVPLVAELEGRRNDPYYDIAKVLTVCDGETHNVQKRRYSDAECDAITNAMLERHAKPLRNCKLPADTPPQSQLAILMTGVNIGSENYCGSTSAKLLRAGDLHGACEAIKLWNKGRSPPWNCLSPYDSRGRCVVRGLVNRRALEAQLCHLGGDLT